MIRTYCSLLLMALTCCSTAGTLAQEFIPRRQSQPPGPPLAPAEAVKKMTVPPGFTVELVAAEPDLQNPVAMCFDEQGRIWVTESFEYPRRSPGPGKDRIKVLEDTTGDGRVDKVTVFAEGLNIPSGIAVGHGGVWVANAPDILFLQDTDGDLKADRQEVIVTGFGRTDTHELPNSLTWGPDGWLYGLNGVFNFCDVRYPESNRNYRAGQPGWKFDAAVFRIHPRTREFELYAEGTSNPWGIAFDQRGEMFLSACVIDHLWHISRGGYYHRQAGAYPPFTWKIESIVDYKHQMAAYCGIEFYDSDAYPEQYRNKLYMGNIHGGCINVDGLEQNGATYRGVKQDDFLTANDVWFMPVAQKTGPDGCLYILDWYDRYHCYQDANADPAGVDRGHGRLYRVRYEGTPRAVEFNLANKSFSELLELLGDGNGFTRLTARRLLQERLLADVAIEPQRHSQIRFERDGELASLQKCALDDAKPKHQRLLALQILASLDVAAIVPWSNELSGAEFLKHPDPDFRVWFIRSLHTTPDEHRCSEHQLPKDQRKLTAIELQPELIEVVQRGLQDESPAVRCEAVIAARTIIDPAVRLRLLLAAQNSAGDDSLMPRLIWRQIEQLITTEGPAIVIPVFQEQRASGFKNLDPLLPRVMERILADPRTKPASIGQLFTLFAVGDSSRIDVARQCLGFVAERVKNRELKGEALAAVRNETAPAIDAIVQNSAHPLHTDSVLLATSWNDPTALQIATRWGLAAQTAPPLRLAAIDAVCAVDEAAGLKLIQQLLTNATSLSPDLLRAVFSSAARMNSPQLAEIVLTQYATLPKLVRPNAIDLLTQRQSGSVQLVAAVEQDRVSKEDVNATQLRRMLEVADAEQTQRIQKIWGQVRDQPRVDRQRAIVRARRIIREGLAQADPERGHVVYNRVCGQCHKLHGQGEEVGPDLTRNGRNNYEQLLSNVFDPNLVIGEAYQARTIVTVEGRVLTGLIAEDSDARVVLKLAGGKTAVIPRDDIELLKISDVSLMPDQLENQLTEQELIDLFAVLTLDKPHRDPTATRLAGIEDIVPQQTESPAEFASLLQQIAPGFECSAVGHRGMAWLDQFEQRRGVLRIHPVSRDQPCWLTSELSVPGSGQPKLELEVAAHPGADWELRIELGQKSLLRQQISQTPGHTWQTITIDLSPYAGQTVPLKIAAAATGQWNNEYGYFSRIEILSTQPTPPQSSSAEVPE